MRLDIYLVKKGLVSSRSKAVHLIKTSQVLVNGHIVLKQSYNVKPDDTIVLLTHFKYVSRGGYKMEAFVEHSGIQISGKTVLDVGCSTGGFSDFFLQNNAKHVIGIDISDNIVHSSLFNNDNFTFIPKVNALDPESLKPALNDLKFQIISIDLSNTPLQPVLSNIVEFLTLDGLIIALFKPHYYLTRPHKMLKEPELESIISEFESSISKDFIILSKMVSPLKGTPKNRGSQEIFYLLKPISAQ